MFMFFFFCKLFKRAKFESQYSQNRSEINNDEDFLKLFDLVVQNLYLLNVYAQGIVLFHN